MSKPIITIYDAMTDSQFDREMTDEEFAEYEATIANTSTVTGPK